MKILNLKYLVCKEEGISLKSGLLSCCTLRHAFKKGKGLDQQEKPAPLDEIQIHTGLCQLCSSSENAVVFSNLSDSWGKQTIPGEYN